MLKEKYTIKDFLPLVGILCAIIVAAVVAAAYFDLSLMRGMQVYMGVFFLVFGLLKVIKLKSFAEAYKMYDLVAARSTVYAYLYPFIELILGTTYLIGTTSNAVNWVTAIIVGISAAGVYNKLRKREKIMCACLGTVFKVPMTWVTLFEDLLMFVMAGYMIIM